MDTKFTRLCRFWAVLGIACGGVSQAAPPDPARTHNIPSFTVAPVQAGVAYERFIVMGDMGTGRPDQHRVAAAMAQRAKSDGLDFMLTVGDNFYDFGVRSVDDPQWKSKLEDVYDDPVLQVSIYPTLGNHDHRGNPYAQIGYSKRNPNWKMPAMHYTFTRTLSDGTKVQFFAIDSEPIKDRPSEAAEQIAWLDQELSQSDAQWKFVYGHHPLYSHSDKNRERERRVMIAALEPILSRNKVDVYFAGHDHTLEMHKPVKGVNHVISGGGGGPEWAYGVEWTDESYYAATLGGFTLCRVSHDELVIEYVRVDGATEYAHTLTKSPVAQVGKPVEQVTK